MSPVDGYNYDLSCGLLDRKFIRKVHYVDKWNKGLGNGKQHVLMNHWSHHFALLHKECSPSYILFTQRHVDSFVRYPHCTFLLGHGQSTLHFRGKQGQLSLRQHPGEYLNTGLTLHSRPHLIIVELHLLYPLYKHVPLKRNLPSCR